MPIFYLKIRVRQTCIFSLNIGISLSILWGAGCVGRAVGLFPHANKTQLNMWELYIIQGPKCLRVTLNWDHLHS